MRTLDLKEAAGLLKMHWQTLRSKAVSGEIPGAKPGKQWVFIEEDLVEYVRSQYSVTGRASSTLGETRCSISETAVNITGAGSPHQTERRYADLLKLPTGNKRKSSK
jgi:excisionase family DNA binding protein